MNRRLMMKNLTTITFICLLAPPALMSGETREMDIVGAGPMMDGATFNNTYVDPEGRIRISGSILSTAVPEDEKSVWSYIKDGDSYLLGTGRGNIYRFSSGSVTKEFETGQSLVTAFASAGGRIYATTIPSGKIFVREGGVWKEFASLQNKNLWDVTADSDGSLYVAASDPAAIVKVTSDGRSSVYFQSKVAGFSAVVKTQNLFACATTSPNYLVGLSHDHFGRILYNFNQLQVTRMVPAAGGLLLVLNQADARPIHQRLDLVGEPPATEQSADTKKNGDGSGSNGEKKEQPAGAKKKGDDYGKEEQNDSTSAPEESAFAQDSAAIPMKSEASSDPISGDWKIEINFEVQIQGQKMTSTVTGDLSLSLAQGRDIKGTMKITGFKGMGGFGKMPDKAVTVTGTLANGKVNMSVAVDNKTLTLEGSISGNRMSGSGSVDDATGMPAGMALNITWSAEKAVGAAMPSADNKKAPPKKVTATPPPANNKPARTPPQNGGSQIAYFSGGFEVLATTSFLTSDIALAGHGELVIASFDDGKLYRWRDNAVSLVTQIPTGKVTKVFIDGSLYALTSSRPAVSSFSTSAPQRGEYISKPIDFKRFVNFGGIVCSGSGNFAVQTRSGNTPDPDEDGWSNWSEFKSGGFGDITSPPGQFLQVKIALLESYAYVDRIAVTYTHFNSSPVIKMLTLAPVNQPDQPVSYNVNVQATDPDMDKMNFYVQIQEINEKQWTPLFDQPLLTPNFQINSADLPDGRYRLRVFASDEQSNPGGRLRYSQVESDVFVIDNSAPVVKVDKLDGGKIRISAFDSTTNIQQISIKYSGQNRWYSLTPADKNYDSVRETAEFEADKTLVERGVVVLVKVVDQMNNSTISQVELAR